MNLVRARLRRCEGHVVGIVSVSNDSGIRFVIFGSGNNGFQMFDRVLGVCLDGESGSGINVNLSRRAFDGESWCGCRGNCHLFRSR